MSLTWRMRGASTILLALGPSCEFSMTAGAWKTDRNFCHMRTLGQAAERVFSQVGWRRNTNQIETIAPSVEDFGRSLSAELTF
jgi:hypothetical protein